MLVMQYASGGDLHKWLQENFANITWNKEKLIILWQISEGYLYLCIHYYNTYDNFNLLFYFTVDLKLFTKQITYIEIFIVETYYMIYLTQYKEDLKKDING